MPIGHHAEAICHHSLSVLHSPHSHVAHHRYLQSCKEIGKGSNGPVCPVCCLRIPASVIMSKSHSNHRSGGKRVARTKAHTLLKVGNRRIRPAVPDPQKTPGTICCPKVWIEPDSPIHHINTDFVFHIAKEERKSQAAQGQSIVSVQFLNALSEAQKLRIVVLRCLWAIC